MKRIAFEELKTSDLFVDAVYESASIPHHMQMVLC